MRYRSQGVSVRREVTKPLSERVITTDPSAIDHTLMSPSEDPDATSLPSGETHTELISIT